MLQLHINKKNAYGEYNDTVTFDFGWPWKVKVKATQATNRKSYMYMGNAMPRSYLTWMALKGQSQVIQALGSSEGAELGLFHI